jgi:hypothetical protein
MAWAHIVERLPSKLNTEFKPQNYKRKEKEKRKNLKAFTINREVVRATLLAHSSQSAYTFF